MKVLAVEDDPMSRFVLVSTLLSLGCEVEEAASTEAAWTFLEQNSVRIVVADWRMPGEDGLQLCRRIRSRGGEYVYFILLTEMEASESNQVLANEAGVDDFLTKPVAAYELGNRLRVANRILGYTVQVRQLESFLPICGYCKKVRNDGNYWEQIEDYINKHTGAPLTHGICPDCYERNVVPQLEEADAASKPVETPPPRTGPRPSLKTIATKLGISSAAVSMALRNNPRISQAMRMRVASVAEELGYRPDPEIKKMMRRMRVQRKVGFKSVIYGLVPAETAASPLLRELTRGCETSAVRRGYGFSTYQIRAGEDGQRIERMLVSRGVEGVLLLGCCGVRIQGNLLDWNRFSVVGVGGSSHVPEFDSVKPHWYESMLRVYGEFGRHGIRRVGAVVSSVFDASIDFRANAAVTWLNSSSNFDPVSRYDPVTGTCGNARDVTLIEWFKSERPEALVFDQEAAATESLKLLAIAGISSPHVAVLDRSETSSFAGIVQRRFEIGMTAIDLLTDKIERGVRGPTAHSTVVKIMGHWARANAATANPSVPATRAS